MEKNTVRIIAGKWRGRVVTFPQTGLRPTANSIRETLFNWLMHDIAGAKCLDLYAGSGALCFEALSRGAVHATALDINKYAVSSIKSNSANLQATELTVINIDAIKWLSNNPVDANIIFVDPPFNNKYLLEKSLQLIENANKKQKSLLVYCESNYDISRYQSCWSVLKSRKTGQVFYTLFGTN